MTRHAYPRQILACRKGVINTVIKFGRQRPRPRWRDAVLERFRASFIDPAFVLN
jgi:hypothetical protein